MALKFRTSGSADDALAQLLQLAQLSQQRQDRKATKSFNNIKTLIDLTSDMDSLTSLGNKVTKTDLAFDDMGDDETGDILKLYYNNKYGIMKKAQNAYTELSKYDSKIPIDAEQFNLYQKDLFDKDWSTLNKEMRNIYTLSSDLEAGEALNMQFKGERDLAPSALKSVVKQYEDNLMNKYNLLAYSGNFDLPDEEGTMKQFLDTFGTAVMSYSPKDFAKFMGSYQSDLESQINRKESKANEFYKLWRRMGPNGFMEGWDVSEIVRNDEGISGEDVLPAKYMEQRYNEYRYEAVKLNNQYKDLFKTFRSTDPRFTEMEYKEPTIKPTGSGDAGGGDTGGGSIDDLMQDEIATATVKSKSKQKSSKEIKPGDVPLDKQFEVFGKEEEFKPTTSLEGFGKRARKLELQDKERSHFEGLNKDASFDDLLAMDADNLDNDLRKYWMPYKKSDSKANEKSWYRYFGRDIKKLQMILDRYKTGKSTGGSAKRVAEKLYKKLTKDLEVRFRQSQKD